MLLGVAAVLVPMPCWAATSRAQIEVVSIAEGDALDVVDNIGQQDLLRSVAARILNDAPDAFPCMEWIAQQKTVHPPTPAASLRAVLRRVAVDSSSKIVLTYYVTIGQAKERRLDSGQDLTLLESLKDQAYGLTAIKKLFDERIAAQLGDEYFRDRINRNLIRYIPIAHSLYLAAAGRIVVPVDAKSMRLSPGSAVVVELDRPICLPPVTNCSLRFSSAGTYSIAPWGGMLSCQLANNLCCDNWPPPSDALELPVYLGEAHGHCSPFQISCEEISRVR